MPVVLPIPPEGTPYTDQQGNVTEPWRRYLLSIEDALSSAAAPSDAQYWVSTASAELTNDRNFGALASGYVKSTVLLGVSTPSTVTSIPAADVTGVALTRVNDTNVTLTLGGTPATALVNAASITAGWSGLLGLARGGTNADLSATGGTSRVLKQASAGAAITVAQLASSDLSDVSNVALKDGTNAFTGATTFEAGGGTTAYAPGGRLHSISAAVSTTGTTEEVLSTYTMPANSLNTDGQTLHFVVGGTTVSNANLKTFRIRVGGISGTTIASYLVASPGERAFFEAYLVRRSSTTAYASAGDPTASQTAVTTDFTGSIDLVLTGQTASAAGDLTAQQFAIEYLG